MEILNKFITSGIIDDSWNIYNEDDANIYYEDHILDIVKNRGKSYTYNIKFHKENKYITCYNGLYYGLDNNNSNNSLFYVFYNSAFVIFVSYIDNYILSDNFKFIKKSDMKNNIFVFYFCDIEQMLMNGFNSDNDSDSDNDNDNDKIDLLNMNGTILLDREIVINKVIIKKRDIELNTLQTPIEVENNTFIESLRYIIDNWNNLPDYLYIISNPVLLKFLSIESDHIIENSLISLDETKYGRIEDNYKIIGNTAISKQYKFKNFWMKELKYNIPPKALIYYNSEKNVVLSKELIIKNNLDFYKKIYNYRKIVSYSIFEAYLEYSFNYIFKI